MNEIEAGLRSALAADTAIIAELNGSTAIYNQLAPQTVSPPYIVFGPGFGGKENISPSDLRNYVYPVKAVTTGEQGSKKAGALGELILTCLHRATLTVEGFTNFHTQAEGQIQFTEVGRDGKPIFHSGYDIRIRIDA